MRTFTRIAVAGLFASAAVLTAVPASAAQPAWCSDSDSPCTAPAPLAATPDGWCVLPGTDICRRY
ncbi:hypothetical protein [Amycolatopsis sp. DG1A-15b]|uniref:hypothetical protein n=1 Tax=Amycolatopsis sp. DG1A-15b TaxID=3052846 RepID=UPI00255B4D9C|nr:hypothetical protein [Amycolatopsis sp. DG1A-15b]WIX87666.1 hypothetical protein QRY02_42090 [Amycolatopsis sp. DG1A-15b]